MIANIRTSFVVVLFCFGLFLTLTRTIESNAQNADAPTEVSELYLRQAETFLRFQQVKLRQAEEFNARVANTISQQDIRVLRDNVDLGKEMLEDVRQGEHSGRETVYLRFAENNLLEAEAALAKAARVRKQVPSSYTTTEMELLQIKAEQATIELELGKKAFASDAEFELRWKVDLLYNELLKLRGDVEQRRIAR